MLIQTTVICKVRNIHWKQHYNFALLQGNQRVKKFENSLVFLIYAAKNSADQQIKNLDGQSSGIINQ